MCRHEHLKRNLWDMNYLKWQKQSKSKMSLTCNMIFFFFFTFWSIFHLLTWRGQGLKPILQPAAIVRLYLLFLGAVMLFISIFTCRQITCKTGMPLPLDQLQLFSILASWSWPLTSLAISTSCSGRCRELKMCKRRYLSCFLGWSTYAHTCDCKDL